MTFVPVQGLWMPGPDFSLINIGAFSANTIDATGEKVSFIGHVDNRDHASKNITKVGFPFGTVNKAGGSALTLSLQDVSLTAGPTYQPDGTPDQTVAIANADAAFVTDAWYLTSALSATRTVAFGELLAVVIEYDGAGRLSTDTVGIKGLNSGGITINRGLTNGVSLFTASWAAQNQYPSLVLEFDDNTFGSLGAGLPVSSLGTISFDTGTATNENGLKFQVPFECKCDGAFFIVQAAAISADFEICLYEGTTLKATHVVDYNSIVQVSVHAPEFALWPEVTLTPDTDYYLVVKPTTLNNVQIPFMNVADANHFQAWAGGPTWHYADRAGAGAWNATTTRRPFAGIRISAVHKDGTGGGGAGGGSIFGSKGGVIA